jgi:hypothetical protein
LLLPETTQAKMVVDSFVEWSGADRPKGHATEYINVTQAHANHWKMLRSSPGRRKGFGIDL